MSHFLLGYVLGMTHRGATEIKMEENQQIEFNEFEAPIGTSESNNSRKGMQRVLRWPLLAGIWTLIFCEFGIYAVNLLCNFILKFINYNFFLIL